jgi:8-oxo-dGTP pyrophosphatase MutT (NUDIX family)
MPMSPYVRSLRAKVGNDLLHLPSVTVMLFDDDGRLLLAQDGSSGLWMTIGGAIEPDETPADAAVRECWEETGLLVAPVKLIGVCGGPWFSITYANGDAVRYTAMVFEARLLGGNARPDGTEAVALRFVSREDAAGLPMAPWTRAMVARAFDRCAEPYFDPPTWTPPSGRPSIRTGTV